LKSMKLVDKQGEITIDALLNMQMMY